MAGLRDKYKPIAIASFKKAVEKEDEEMASSNGRSEFIELKDGKTVKIRFMPAHPGEENFYVRRKIHWITIEQDGDQVRRTVANSIEHGGYKMDIIEEYMALAFKVLNASDKDDLEKIECIKGDYPRKGGLKGSLTWVAYALEVDGDDRKFGLFEFKKTVRDAINKEAKIEDDDSPIEVDPFTDPDGGFPVLIKYNSKPNKKKNENYYEVSIGKKAVKLTDEELDRLDKATPLSELYGKYTMKDFERALEGLQIFDAEHDINLFENDEWLSKVEEVKSQFSNTEEEEDEKPKSSKGKTAPEKASKTSTKSDLKASQKKIEFEEEADDEEEGEDESTIMKRDKFDSMSREELKAFNTDNELGIVVRKSMTDEDIREQVRTAWESTQEKTNESIDEEEDETEEVEVAAEEESVNFDELDRTELKQYISDNSLQSDIKVMKSMSDDDIRNALKKYYGMDEEVSAEEEAEEEEAPAPKKGKSLSVDDIRSKLKGKK